MSVHNYANDEVRTSASDLPDALFDKYIQQEEAKAHKLIESHGKYTPYELHKHLGEELTASCTVVKTEERMKQSYEVVRELKQQYQDLKLSDTGVWTNQNLSFARALGDMLRYAEAIVVASIERKESRGSHFRPDYPDRNDEKFLKTTVVNYDAANDKPIITWEDVPTPLVEPRVRN